MDQIEIDRAIMENSLEVLDYDIQIAHNDSVISLLYAGLIEDAIDVIKDRNNTLKEMRKEKVNEIHNLEACSEIST